jgi:GTP-binding protein
MEVKTAEFITSSTALKDCPPPKLPEYAFIGRSNVGKSSLINLLTGRKALAKTSVKPGKTQTINHFLINDTWYLVDLPGVGYAKVSKTEKVKWEKMIKNYLLKRENLQCVFLLIDSRHELQDNDSEMIKFLGANAIPFVLIFTKMDKISRPVLDKNVASIKRELLKSWNKLPQIFLTSSEKRIGKEDILKLIGETNKSFKVPLF